jgi:hypothetical protein
MNFSIIQEKVTLHRHITNLKWALNIQHQNIKKQASNEKLPA